MDIAGILFILIIPVAIFLLPPIKAKKKWLLFYSILLGIFIILKMAPIIIPIFVIPVAVFLIPQFIKKKKWLLFYSILIGTLISYAYYDLGNYMNKPENNAGIGDALAATWLVLMFIPYLSGIITRVITLYLGYKNYSPRLRLITTIAGFASIPVIIYIPALL